MALTASRSLAAKCTAIMHQRQPEDLSEEEVRDGWEELTNMVGGNLKALVPPESRLSLPEIRAATGYGWTELGLLVLNQVTFACLGQRIRLCVLVRSVSDRSRSHPRAGPGPWPPALPG